MSAAALALLTGAAGMASTAAAEGPRRAPAIFATEAFGLTFRTPRRATYCPLPDERMRSDHGTIVFLERPRSCGDAGFPTHSRGFEPANVARVILYYGYAFEDDEPPPEGPCDNVETVVFLGGPRPVCAEDAGESLVRHVSAYFMVELRAEAVLTLVTRPERLERDMAAFRQVAASVRTCSVSMYGPEGLFDHGSGARCPRTARWF